MSDRAASILEALPEAVLGVDAGGVVRLANDAAASLFRSHRDALVGQDADDLVPGVRPDDGAPLTLEVTARRTDGTSFPARLRAVAVAGEGGDGLVVAVVQEVVAPASAPMRGALVHDLTNQLAIVSAYARFALDALDAEGGGTAAAGGRPSLREDLQEIHTAATRAQTLTRELIAGGGAGHEHASSASA